MKYLQSLLIGALLLSSLSLWGCTQQKTGVISAKVRDLESRYAKLEEDYRLLQNTHDQNRKRLTQSEALRAALEAQKSELARQLETAEGQREEFRKQADLRTSERDEFKKQADLRTSERDTAHTNLMQFSKDLQALASRVETAMNAAPSAPAATIVPASRRVD